MNPYSWHTTGTPNGLEARQTVFELIGISQIAITEN
ncbi:MAG: hypothetical protein JWO71_1543 [Candidatus Acidoferrum typicum]|jgi:hypothetical protein|nr:hypothetical protein [Candidatus Acidoferrum typicum]